MEFLRATSWSDALSLKASRPDVVPIAGGTDVMVEINFDRRRPSALLDLNPVADLADWYRDDGEVVIGAGVPYTRLIDELGAELPGLAAASRTVGSPQIRNRGTLGGNLGSASPAGDTHPVLLALGATVHADSVRASLRGDSLRADAVGVDSVRRDSVRADSPGGPRDIPIDDFYLGVKRSALADDELIRSVRVPIGTGPCHFAKIGTRNAMVIAVCSFAVAFHVEQRRVRTGIGSAAPTPRRAIEAEAFAESALDWNGGRLDDDVARRFGQLAATAAVPISDVRGTAAYRRHAIAVLARRTLRWAWEEYRACG